MASLQMELKFRIVPKQTKINARPEALGAQDFRATLLHSWLLMDYIWMVVAPS
jgi:hypothetical protein